VRIGLGIDDSVDVSEQLLKSSGMFVLPSTLHLGTERSVIGRDPNATTRLYSENWLSQYAGSAVSSALSVEEIERLFAEALVPAFDYVFLITLMGERSETPRNASRAARKVMREAPAQRARRNLPGPFALKVIDSGSVFSGPALLAWEAARMIKDKALPSAIRDRLDALTPNIDAHLVPKDIAYMRGRLLRRGDRSLNWLNYQIGRVLDLKPILRARRGKTHRLALVRGYDAAVSQLFERACHQLQLGLDLPCIAVSYGGALADLETLPGFADLRALAATKRVEIMTAVMSAVGAANVGAGAVSLSYCRLPGQDDDIDWPA